MASPRSGTLILQPESHPSTPQFTRLAHPVKNDCDLPIDRQGESNDSFTDVTDFQFMPAPRLLARIENSAS
jgi:hypothetical protein